MSRLALIFITCFVNICILAHTLIPHHHHGNSIAFLVGEFVEMDLEGYEHHHDDGTSHHAHSEDEILVWAAEQQMLGSSIATDFFPSYDWIAINQNSFLFNIPVSLFECLHLDNINFNIQTPYIYINSLRAPPVC